MKHYDQDNCHSLSYSNPFKTCGRSVSVGMGRRHAYSLHITGNKNTKIFCIEGNIKQEKCRSHCRCALQQAKRKISYSFLWASYEFFWEAYEFFWEGYEFFRVAYPVLCTSHEFLRVMFCFCWDNDGKEKGFFNYMSLWLGCVARNEYFCLRN